MASYQKRIFTRFKQIRPVTLFKEHVGFLMGLFSFVANYAAQVFMVSPNTPKTFTQTHTLTRSTPRYVWDASGQLVAIAANQPCYEYDPATGEAKGLFLSPDTVTNLDLNVNYPPVVSITSPYAQADTLTYSVSAEPSPVSGQLVAKLTETTATGRHDTLYQATNGSVIHSVSCICKADGRTKINLRLGNAGDMQGAAFDLTTGVISDVAVDGSAQSVDLGDGWFWVSVTRQTPRQYAAIRLQDSSGAEEYLGDGVSGILVTCPLVSEAITVPPVILTVGQAETTVAADVCDLAALPTDYGTIGCFILDYADPQIGSAVREMLGDGTNAFFQLSADNLTVSATDGTNTASTAVTATGKNKVAVAWDATTVKICANGATPVAAAHNGNLGSFASPPRLARGVAAWYSLLQYLPSTNTGNVIATDAKMQELTT